MSSTWIALTKTWWYLIGAELSMILSIPEKWFSVLAILMVFDLITWIAKQFVLNPREITSHRLWIWIVKKIITLLLIISIGLMFYGTWIDWKEYINAVVWIFIVWETYSITWNAYTVRTWKNLPEYDVISIVIKTIWEIIKTWLERYLSKK